MNRLVDALKRLLVEAVEISFRLFKIMIPVIVAVKILKELGAVEWLAVVLSPVMEVVGLPGGMGLVWATTLLTNLYGGMIVFVSLSSDFPVTVAQATVLTTMMLVAHGLPVELRIAQKAGVRLLAMGMLRVGGAFLLGFVLDQVYASGGWLQEPNVIPWIPPAQDTSLLAWGVDQAKGLVLIFFIILALLAMIKVLTRLGITNLITKSMHPLLRVLGIGNAASTITIIGMTLGLAYGGALIIQEATSDRIGKKDIVFSLAFMGLSHSLIEDTLLAALLGGHLSGILWGRIIFSLLCIFLLVKWISRVSDAAFERYFFHSTAR